MEKKIVRFEIQDLLPIGFTLIVAGIGLVYGLNVVGDVRSDMADNYPTTATCNVSGSGDISGCGYDVNASSDAIRGIAKIPEKMPLIATVIVAAVIIGILIRYLMVRFA